MAIPAIVHAPGETASLSYARSWRPCLARTLLAAASLPIPVGLRLSLTRERITPEQADQMRGLLESLHVQRSASDAGHDGSGVPAAIQAGAAAAYVEAFATHHDYVRFSLEASADAPVPEVFLRLAGAELFPRTSLQIEERTGARETRARAARAENHLDLSTALAYPHWAAPMLPDPWILERLSFPRHIENVSVHMAGQGVHLGHMMQNGFEQPVMMAEPDRSRHVYVLGATGTGKSTLVYNMARQDIEAGQGVAVIDPHGDLFEQLLESLPSSRLDDVVIIDPSDTEHPIGLNPMAFPDGPSEREMNRLIGDLMEMMLELHPELREWAARFEQFFRNGALLVMNAEPQPSFERLVALFGDERYRHGLLSKCTIAKVRTFFEMAQRTVGENHFDNWGPAITSKFSSFVDNPVLNAILCSPRKTIDYRTIMDEKRILLVNLAKGAIGTIDARLIGMLVTDGLFQAALSRHSVPRERRTPFYLYLDEFQNFTTRTIADVLAEARKYGLRLVLAHQTLGQLVDPHLSPPTRLIDAVLGNVATKLFMRVGLDEARLLEPNLLPQFDARTLATLPDRRVICRLLVDNRPSPPFVFSTLAPMAAHPPAVVARHRATAIAASRRRYGCSPPAAAAVRDREAATARQTERAVDEPDDPDVAAALDEEALSRPEFAWRATGATLQLLTQRRGRTAVPPRAGRFFQTFDDAIAYVALIDEDGDAACAIVRSGRTESPLGMHFWVSPQGYSKESAALTGLARALLRELDVEPVDARTASGRNAAQSVAPGGAARVPDSDAAGAQADAERAAAVADPASPAPSSPTSALPRHVVAALDGALSTERAACNPVRGELFTTANGSLVLPDGPGPRGWRVYLLSGGHGFGEIPGFSMGGWYQVDAQGGIVVERRLLEPLSDLARLEIDGLCLTSIVWLRWPDGRLDELGSLRFEQD